MNTNVFFKFILGLYLLIIIKIEQEKPMVLVIFGLSLRLTNLHGVPVDVAWSLKYQNTIKKNSFVSINVNCHVGQAHFSSKVVLSFSIIRNFIFSSPVLSGRGACVASEHRGGISLSGVGSIQTGKTKPDKNQQ